MGIIDMLTKMYHEEYQIQIRIRFFFAEIIIFIIPDRDEATEVL